jgi:alkaline phosphatase
MPHLSQLSRTAIDLLDAKSARNRDQGFFLQIEGASIDKQDHASNPCGQIGETVEFDHTGT